MKSSGPKNPCPCCSRVKTSHCRWDDSRVFCYQGVSHRPPADLKKGDTIVLDDQTKYFFAGYDKGFAGNSALFCLHDPRNDRLGHPRSRSRRRGVRREDIRDLEALRGSLDIAQKTVSQALAAPNYHHITPDEIRGWMVVINSAFEGLTKLKRETLRLRHLDPLLQTVFESMTEQLRDLSYQKQDFDQFWFDQLCDPADGKGKRLADLMRELEAPAIAAAPEFDPDDW